MIDRYTYRITWSSEDGEHVGLCAEFPSLSWLAPTPEKALSGVRRLVRDIVADMEETGEEPPEPLADKAFSGKFLVRLAAGNAPGARHPGGGARREPQPSRQRLARGRSGMN